MRYKNDVEVESIEITTECTAMCSLGNAPFYAAVTVEYGPVEWLLEFIEYEEWLGRFASIGSTTIEELCNNVFVLLWERLEPQWLVVSVAARTDVHSPVTVKRKGYGL